MSTRIVTLFGEEVIPEVQKPPVKLREKKEAETSPKDQPEGIATPLPAPVVVLPIEARQVAIPEVTENAPPNQTASEAADTDDPNIIAADWDGDKTYYTIGEVADFFKVKTSHIRFWTNEFKLKVRTTRKGDRLFTPEQVKELRAIYHLVKERKFTLSGAKAKLKTQNKRDVTTVDLKTALQQFKSKLIILRNQLDG